MITINEFIASVQILATDLINQTDDKLRTIMSDIKSWLEAEAQSAITQLEDQANQITIDAQDARDAAQSSESNASNSEQAAAQSAASVDANNIIHAVGSGLANEGYDKTATDTLLATKANDSETVHKTDYASSTVGGAVKLRVDGTTLYITTNGNDA